MKIFSKENLGITFPIVSGTLFLIMYMLLEIAPYDQLVYGSLTEWIASKKIFVAFSNEILVFAALFIVPAIIGVYNDLKKYDKAKVGILCLLIFSFIPVFVVVDMIQGRLVYPIGNLQHTNEIDNMFYEIVKGGFHMIYLLFCVCSILFMVIDFKIRRKKSSIVISVVIAISNIIGSYPWMLSTEIRIITEILFSIWFIYLGSCIYKINKYAKI